MIPVAIYFVVLVAGLLLRLPKRLAALPLLAGAAYMTQGQEVEIGSLHFTVSRILIGVGAVRVIMRCERIAGGLNRLDLAMILWGLCAVNSSFFHQDISAALIFRLGLFYDGLGFYFLFRVFVQGTSDTLIVFRIVLIVLLPIAAEMVLESVTGRNTFSVLGGVGLQSEIRDGTIRAQGPFAHSILAGTVGATSWPFLLPFWKNERKLALLALGACGIMIITSRSSGPLMTTLFVLIGMCTWKVRQHMRLVRWGALGAIIALDIVMNAPVYYLFSRIDLTGSSTGLHRAEVIHAALTHLGEWWLAGTDYTRHWMPYGVLWSANHIDITNQYIKMGVIGGLPLMISFIIVLIVAFSSVGKTLLVNEREHGGNQFIIWILGVILFGHAATFMSVNYFDQSFLFFLLVLASIGSFSGRCKTSGNQIAQHQVVSCREGWAKSRS